jgi:hypothetical protein
VAEVIVFPDAEGLVIDYLRDLLDVPVSGTVPNPRPGEFVTVRRLGGVRRNLVTDAPMLTVEAWAAGDVAAHDLAQLARAHVHAMARASVLTEPAVYRVVEIAGPGHLPDPVSAQSRYVFTVEVAVRGAALTV